MVIIFCHSTCLLSAVTGRNIILLIRKQYAAILCSVGWLEVKLIVISVVVGFLNMSISIFGGSGLLIGQGNLHYCCVCVWG
jgi:hypothetical protein